MQVDRLELKDYAALIDLAVAEDLGGGDVTSEVTIPTTRIGCGELVFREPGVVCGLDIVREVLRRYDANLRLEAKANDGDKIVAGQSVGRVEGQWRAMLAAERVMLNFLQRLSGVATITARYVEAVRGTQAALCDTRKTTPGWRLLEKYAVRCGGGVNHRTGLFDAVLIKDNHLAAMSGGDLTSRLTETITELHSSKRNIAFVEVEVDTLDQLARVLPVAGVDMVLLDNMSLDQLRQAVTLRDQACRTSGRNVLLEASGGVTLQTVGDIAATGVDRISVGALTHSVRSLDIGLDAE